MLKKIFSSFLCLTVILLFAAEPVSADSSGSAGTAKVYSTPYYYYQLTDNAKEIYKMLKKAVMDCSSVVKTRTDIERKDFEQLAELLIFHDPMTFNLENIELFTVGNLTVFKLSYRYDKEEYDEMTSAYKKEADKILDKLTDDMSEYKKIRTIHDSIINSAAYDLESEANDTVYGTLVNNKGKCDGYSKSFSYICGLAGIRTVTVIGDDKINGSGMMHMWNKVYYNKNWYNVDVTWDDPVGNLKDNLQYDFFMVSDSSLKNTHKENNFSFEVPEADDDSKNYFAVNKKYAEDFGSAKTILNNGLVSASKKQKNRVVLKCASNDVYEKMKNYILDKNKISVVIKNAGKKTHSKLISDIYSYKFNDDQKIICLFVFYEDTDIYDYFTSTDKLDSDALEILSKYGVSSK
ncbi:MAG: hypothetical protein NC395_00560 [Prevotella sp.]|nr:hypothetical protein [Prevotella sp.]